MSATSTAMSSTAPLCEVVHLRKYFPVRGGFLRRVVGHIRAVEDVSLTIFSGRTLGLVGESGCGKSTLGRTIIRLQEPTAGSIVFEGVDLAPLGRRELTAWRRKMQIVFQDPYAALSPRRTVGQIIREPLDLHRAGSRGDRERRVRELLDVVGLGGDVIDRYPHEFSGGQRQRVGIARALALNPRLIVADEPVSALDVSVQSQILNLVRDLQREFRIAFLFISHDLAVIQHVSDEVAVMYLGKLVEHAPVDRLFARPMHPYTEALLSAVPRIDSAGRRRIVLSGDVPSPSDPPAGCPFHPRCPKVMDVCHRVVPELRQVGGPAEADRHLAACHLHD